MLECAVIICEVCEATGVAAAGARGQFMNIEERQRQPLEAATGQQQ